MGLVRGMPWFHVDKNEAKRVWGLGLGVNLGFRVDMVKG